MVELGWTASAVELAICHVPEDPTSPAPMGGIHRGVHNIL
jgi:hypothetical protein